MLFRSNENAALDLEDSELKRLDVVIASIHQSRFGPKNPQEHTKMLLKVMDNPNVDILGHIGREKTEFDIEAVVKKAKETKKLIEINSFTLGYKSNMKRRCLEIAQVCKKHSLPIVVSSDSHICYNVGDVQSSVSLLKEVGYDEALIMNTTFERIAEFLELRKQ